MRVGTHVFERVVCGADGSEAGSAAVEIAARVTAPGGSLVLLTVDDPSIAVHAGWAMSDVLERIRRDATDATAHAAKAAQTAHPDRMQTRLVEGNPLDSVRAELDRVDATLAVVGTHGHSRAVGIALGSVTTHLLHEARCSVLVARRPHDADGWPRTIVVGVDGSDGSAAAFSAARDLGERLDADVRAISATREAEVDLDAARRIAPDVDEVDDRVLHVLHDASADADLLVVGNRGLRGLRALGSVSERVAHEAVCSVLVVRGDG